MHIFLQLTTSMLNATDSDNNNTLINFTVNAVQHRYYDKSSNPAVPITTFIQQEVIDGVIRFVHDGNELAPSYEIKVSDGELETPFYSAEIIFIPVNDYPVLGNNKLIIHAPLDSIPDNIEQHLDEGIKELRKRGYKIDYELVTEIS